jgi:structural maintenance of chromosome 2
MKIDQKSATDLNKKRDAAITKCQKLRDDIGALAFDENQFSSLEQEKDHLSSSISNLEGIVKNLSSALERRLSFNYTDPVRGFDRSKVKGLVANLIQVNKEDYATALEVVAGGKLYQVVVDEAIVGKALIERGNLARRVTIIPLDKITSRSVSNSAIERACQIAKSMNAESTPAIELIGFDEEVRAAMEHVFGSAIVVNSSKAANQICESTKTRTVTLQGDVYDPSGTISGGSSDNFGTTLVDLARLAESKKKLAIDIARLDEVNALYSSLKYKATKHEKIAGALDIAEAELQGILKHLSQTSYGVLEEKFTSMSSELVGVKQEYVSMQKEQEEKWALYNELKEKEVELTQKREERIGAMEAAVKEAKKNAADKADAAREVRVESLRVTLLLPFAHINFYFL